MALLENGGIHKDSWQKVEDEAIPVPSGAVLVSYDYFLAHRKELLARNAPLGVLFPNDKDPAELAADLEHFTLIALHFPAFRDGRAFSQARILRERYKWRKTLRVTGDILPDQYLFALRCGFDSVEVPDGADAEVWRKAAAAYDIWYQSTGAQTGESPEADIIVRRHPNRSTENPEEL